MLYDRKWELDAVGRLLLDTANAVENGEWCQHAGRVGEARCVMHWLNDTMMAGSGRADDYMRAVDRLAAHLNRMPDAWNDMPGRTKAEVVAALREAATVR